MSNQVKIGPEFFAKIKLDYNNWRWALAREFLQNCFDAPGCRDVRVGIQLDEKGDTVLAVSNDGRPMNLDTLESKLLTLGGSGKNFDGENTGGFGVAKSLLYYTHQGYAIRTGNLVVEGSGAQYTITESENRFNGTASSVSLKGDEVEKLVKEFRRFAAYAQWNGKLAVNGEVLNVNLHKGTRRKDLGWATVYTNKTYSNTAIVRINGQPMFTAYTRFAGTVILELTGKANNVLTSNRDGLIGGYASDFSDLLATLAVDKRSALREQRAEYRRWKGEKLRNEAEAPKGMDSLAAFLDLDALRQQVNGGEVTEEQSVAADVSTPIGLAGGGGIKLVVVSREDATESVVSLGSEFIIKNTTGKKTRAQYVPGDRFSDYSKALLKSWTGLLLKFHQLLNRGGEFSVGFIFDEENEAECEQTSAFGQVYYINPLKDGKPRFKNTWTDRHVLVSLAAHEIVHGVYGLNGHDEDYAGKLTDVLAVAMANQMDLSELCWMGEDAREQKEDDAEERYLAAIFQLESQEREIERLKLLLKEQ